MHVSPAIDTHVRLDVPYRAVAHEFAVGRDHNLRVGLQVKVGRLPSVANLACLDLRLAYLLDGAGIQESSDGFHVIHLGRTHRKVRGQSC